MCLRGIGQRSPISLQSLALTATWHLSLWTSWELFSLYLHLGFPISPDQVYLLLLNMLASLLRYAWPIKLLFQLVRRSLSCLLYSNEWGHRSCLDLILSQFDHGCTHEELPLHLDSIHSKILSPAIYFHGSCWL